MARAAQFMSVFLAACAANSLVGWLAFLAPEGAAIAKAYYVVVVLVLLFGVICDDGVQTVVKVEPWVYYTALGFMFFSVLVGGALVWISR